MENVRTNHQIRHQHGFIWVRAIHLFNNQSDNRKCWKYSENQAASVNILLWYQSQNVKDPAITMSEIYNAILYIIIYNAQQALVLCFTKLKYFFTCNCL